MVSDKKNKEVVRLPSGNIKLPNGRICSENLNSSQLVSNNNKHELIANVEYGIKELVVKFIVEGYDILSSCQGHPEDECLNNSKYIKICCEGSGVKKIMDNINQINNKYHTTLQCSVGEESTEEGKQWILNCICAKKYENPVNVYIWICDYGDSDYNYEMLLEHFDEYDWEPI